MTRSRNILLWLSFFLLVFGSRMIVCNHFAVDAPFSDDWEIAGDIVKYRDSPVLEIPLFKAHGQHIIAFTRFEQFFTAKYNGIWQMRVLNVFHSVAFSLFALVTLLIINRALDGKKSVTLFAAGLVTFAIPWAGDRMLWTLLSCFSWMMLWSIVEAAVLALVRPLWLRLALSLTVCSLASVSIGAGSLSALIAATWAGWLIIRSHPKERLHHVLFIALHLGLFLFFYLLVPAGRGITVEPATVIKAILRCLAFPTINVWLIGIFAFMPWFTLVARTLKLKGLPSKGETLLLLMGAAVVLQSIGIGFFRGDNDNGGVPASRYYDILVLGPIVNFSIILLYLDQLPQRITKGGLAVFGWVAMTMAGFMLLFFWRVTPWLSLDSGEWEQGLKQAAIATWVRGDIENLPDYADKQAPELSYHDKPNERIRKYVSPANNPSSIVPGAMIAGYALKPAAGSTGFTLNGFPGNRIPRPWLNYWGSHDRTGAHDKPQRFESEPFDVAGNYLQFDFILDKKSRFRFYSLGNSSLKLIKLSDGTEIDLLRKLARTFPSILGDRESICVKLSGPGSYKIVAEDNQVDSGWFAFSEPTAAGPLGFLAQAVLNSGKLVMFAGLMLLLASGFLGRFDSKNAGLT